MLSGLISHCRVVDKNAKFLNIYFVKIVMFLKCFKSKPKQILLFNYFTKQMKYIL